MRVAAPKAVVGRASPPKPRRPRLSRSFGAYNLKLADPPCLPRPPTPFTASEDAGDVESRASEPVASRDAAGMHASSSTLASSSSASPSSSTRHPPPAPKSLALTPYTDDDVELDMSDPLSWLEPYHGQSTKAFAYRKQFWLKRSAWHESVEEDELEQFIQQSLPSPLLPPSPPSPPLPEPEEDDSYPRPKHSLRNTQAYDPNSKIYPRAGDLGQLRNAYNAMMDRIYHRFPSYSLSKWFFQHDMLERATAFKAGRLTSAPRRSSPLASVSAYSPDSDDSDIEDSRSPTPASSYTTSDSESTGDSLPRTPSPLSPSDPAPSYMATPENPRPWETCWYAKWQLLTSNTPRPPLPVPPAYAGQPESDEDDDAEFMLGRVHVELVGGEEGDSWGCEEWGAVRRPASPKPWMREREDEREEMPERPGTPVPLCWEDDEDEEDEVFVYVPSAFARSEVSVEG